VKEPLGKKSRKKEGQNEGEHPGNPGEFGRGETEKLMKTDAGDGKQQEIE
jgi:hypothetical protein